MGKFPIPNIKVMVSSMVDVLVSNPDFLTSKTHVDLALDVCAQGLTLPLAEFETILRTIELFKKWLSEPNGRPKPINEDEEYFTQVNFFKKN